MTFSGRVLEFMRPIDPRRFGRPLLSIRGNYLQPGLARVLYMCRGRADASDNYLFSPFLAEPALITHSNRRNSYFGSR